MLLLFYFCKIILLLLTYKFFYCFVHCNFCNLVCLCLNRYKILNSQAKAQLSESEHPSYNHLWNKIIWPVNTLSKLAKWVIRLLCRDGGKRAPRVARPATCLLTKTCCQCVHYRHWLVSRVSTSTTCTPSALCRTTAEWGTNGPRTIPSCRSLVLRYL